MNKRIAVSSLGASAALLVAIAGYEGYSDRPIEPVKGDVPTIGFGRTHGVAPNERTNPVRELVKLHADIDQRQKAMADCLGDIPLHHHEWEAYTSLAYNIGTYAWCRSTLVKRLKRLDYAGACREILRWDKFDGKPLRGLTIRRQKEYQQCLG